MDYRARAGAGAGAAILTSRSRAKMEQLHNTDWEASKITLLLIWDIVGKLFNKGESRQAGSRIICWAWSKHIILTVDSVSDPYSSNPDPDPAENLNLDPDPERPWIRSRILAISLHYLKNLYYFIIISFYHQKKSIKK